jgi:hypothetical protein
MMAARAGDEFTGRMFEAINGMLLDMLAAVARKDYDDRRRRQAQGQAKAKAEGKYKGRAEDVERNAGIARMLATGQSWGMIQSVTGCSRATISKIAKRIKQAAGANPGPLDISPMHLPVTGTEAATMKSALKFHRFAQSRAHHSFSIGKSRCVRSDCRDRTSISRAESHALRRSDDAAGFAFRRADRP